MKYCIHCGMQLADNARFCSACGGATSSGVMSASHSAPVAAPVVPPASAAPIVKDRLATPASDPVGLYFKKVATSPLFIILSVVYSAFLILQISIALDPLDWLSNLLDIEIGSGESAVALFGVVLSALDEAKIVTLSALEERLTTVMLIAQIPNVLIVVGLWVTFFLALNASALRDSRGVSLIAVLYKVLRVIYPILLVLLSFSFLSACSELSEYKDSIRDAYYYQSAVQAASKMQAILMGIAFAFWAMAGFVIWYLSRLIESLESIAYSISHSRASCDISMAVIVIFFIGAGFALVSAVSAEDNLLWMNLLNAAIQILAASLLLSMRERLAQMSRTYRAEVPSSAVGGWHCVCGRTHPSYVSSCPCGRSKSGAAATYSTPAVARWECSNCYNTNPPAAHTCTRCGFRKVEVYRDATPLSNGNWRCTCGRVNPAFVSTCSCGQSKNRH